MTTTSNSLALVEDALVALLLTDATLAGLSSGMGKPALGEPQDPPRECVFVYEGATSDREPKTTGADWEVSAIRVGVLVAKSEDWKTCRDRCAVLAAIVETLVDDNHTLGSASIDDVWLARIERSAARLGEDRNAALMILTLEARVLVA